MTTLQASLELYQKLPVLVSESTCSGKVYIVTGANTGLGLETARHLVAASAKHVILAVRNVAAGQKAREDIEKSTGVKGTMDVWPLDLASFDSVRSFAKQVSGLARLDCLVANAGVMMDKWSTAEGMETCVTINVISTLLLGVLLLPKLAESGRIFGGDKPRVVFVVSTLGFQSKSEMDKSGNGIVFDGLNDPKRANMDQRYIERFHFASPYGTNKLPQICRHEAGRDICCATACVPPPSEPNRSRHQHGGSRSLFYRP